jgi:hypothetical protein
VKHFPFYAQLESKVARVVMIGAHVPVMAVTYTLHVAGSLVHFAGAISSDIIAVSSLNVQDLAHNIFTGLLTILKDVGTVYAGVASKNPAVVVPAVVQTAKDALKVEQGVVELHQAFDAVAAAQAMPTGEHANETNA